LLFHIINQKQQVQLKKNSAMENLKESIPSQSSFVRGTIGVLCVAGAVWFAKEESAHKELAKQKHDKAAKLRWLQSSFVHNQSEIIPVKRSHDNEHKTPYSPTIKFEIPMPNFYVYHPDSNVPMQFTKEDREVQMKLDATISFLSSSKEEAIIELRLKKVFLKDISAYASAYYDLYPLTCLRVNLEAEKHENSSSSSSFSSKHWIQAFHVVEVANYWFPASDFKIYLSYQFQLPEEVESQKVSTRFVQIAAEFKPSTFESKETSTSIEKRKIIAPRVTVATTKTAINSSSSSMITTQLPLPHPFNEQFLTIRSFAQPNGQINALFQLLPSELFLRHNLRSNTPYFFGFHLVTTFERHFLFVIVRFTETGIAQAKWIETLVFNNRMKQIHCDECSNDTNNKPLEFSATTSNAMYDLKGWALQLSSSSSSHSNEQKSMIGIISFIKYKKKPSFACLVIEGDLENPQQHVMYRHQHLAPSDLTGFIDWNRKKDKVRFITTS
jgi:hypothetical protein